MRSDHRGATPLEFFEEHLLLGRGIRVEIHDMDGRGVLQEVHKRGIGVVDIDLHEGLAKKVRDLDLGPRDLVNRCPGAIDVGTEVQGADKRIRPIDVIVDLVAAAEVIAKRDAIDPRVEKGLVFAMGEAAALASVLPVDDDEVGGKLLPEGRQGFLDSMKPDLADDIAEKEDSHRLFRGFDRAIFADDRDLDLAWVGNAVFDFRADVLGHLDGFGIAHLLGDDHDADLAAGLHRIGLRDAVILLGDGFQGLDALDVGLEGFAASAGTRGGKGIRGRDEIGDDEAGGDVAVVALDRVEDDLGLAISLREFITELDVGPFLLEVDGFSDVMEQTGAAGEVGIEAEFPCHEAGKIGDFHRMGQSILAIGSAVMETTDVRKQFAVDAGEAKFEAGFLAVFLGGFSDFALAFSNDVFDAARLDAAVLH